MVPAPRTAAAGALLLCCWPPLPAQGVLLHRAFAPDFSACDAPGHCGPEGLPSHYLPELLANVNSSAARKLAAGETPTMLHIGAANLGNQAQFADRDLYNKVASTLSEAVSASLKLVLVEPNDFFLEELKSNAETLPIASRDRRIVHGMVAGSCEGKSSTMYRFSRRPEREFGLNYGVYGSWFSSQRTQPLDALRHFASIAPSVLADGALVQRFRRFSAMPNVSDYLEEVQVPCFTPASLLAATGSRAGDLAMVVTDAESADAAIVRGLLALPGFRPGYLQWEAGSPGGLGAELQARRFQVGKVLAAGGGNHDASNCVAVAAD